MEKAKIFPIQTETACQLKWNWSTVYLTTENTASCHRTNHHKFDTEQFNFHNTPTKIQDRENMLEGKWPEKGCEYCKNIEEAGGQSDRLTNLKMDGMYPPIELESNLGATTVTPRILEVYFDNTCNLKCLYCGPWFSSLWDAEFKKYGSFRKDDLYISGTFKKSTNIESNKQKLFEWLRINAHQLVLFNVLGGEPLYQKELDECLDLFRNYPAPELKFQIFTNLNSTLEHLTEVVEKAKLLVTNKCIREFEVTVSLDCWGAPASYVRFPLDLVRWEENFTYLLSQPTINLIINSTITPLTIKTLPDLLAKINEWSKVRPVYHYQNSVNHPTYLFIDMFGDIFKDDFEKAIALKSEASGVQRLSKKYLQGIASQSVNGKPDVGKIRALYNFLNEMDYRRKTFWPDIFPWLVSEFAKYGHKLPAKFDFNTDPHI